MKLKALKLAGSLLLLIFIGAALKSAQLLWQSRSDGIPLAIRWEGAWIDTNFRDVGASLNECLGRHAFREGAFARSNAWFSGWSCEKVGDPDVILSLNFAPERNERYYCRDDAGENIVGRHFNDRKLHDLEFVETWDDARVAAAICGFVADGLAEIAAGKKVLAHCDAGKDRTGMFSALLPAAAAEARGLLDDDMVAALECDYQKSRRLERDKHGRITTFIGKLRAQGGVGAFLLRHCGIVAGDVMAASERLISPL